MPSVSKKQHNAMEAAAHGHSTLGIPKSVGEDFSNADKGRKFAGGGPVTAASIEAGGTPNQGGWGGGALTSSYKPTKNPTVDPISTTNTPPGGSVGFGGGLGGGMTPPSSSPSQPFWDGELTLADGGMVPNTMGASYSFPPPPGQRKQGPRNYGKKE
jgi:hypothetical protein